MNYKNVLKFVLLLGTFIMFTSCGDDNENNNSKPIEVKAKTVEASDVAGQLEYPGTIEGESKVKLSTKLMGQITYLPYETGNKVKKGELLIKINSGDISAKKKQVKANIAQAEAAFKNAEINYERIKSLYKKNSASKKEMEDVQMGYDMAKARLNAAREMKNEIENVLSYSEIRSPFDGYIVNKFFEKGDIAAPGHPIVIVENLDKFKVTAMVPASDINLLEVGEKVIIVVDAASEENYSGKIVEINPSGNSYSKQFEVRASFNGVSGTNSKIKSGMYATIISGNQSKELVTVDEEVLVRRGQLVGVYSVSDNNEAMLRWIRLGKSINGKFEVLSGLSEGDIIIIDKEKVKEGQKVEVI